VRGQLLPDTDVSDFRVFGLGAVYSVPEPANAILIGLLAATISCRRVLTLFLWSHAAR
jgi:hypothetical protein